MILNFLLIFFVLDKNKYDFKERKERDLAERINRKKNEHN